jgi:hypothetical protein
MRTENKAPHPPGVEIHIEELVLHGLAPGDRHGIGDAVQIELARLFAGDGAARLSGGPWAAGALDAGEFRLPPGATAQVIGVQVARAVYGQISRAKAPVQRGTRGKTERTGR